MRPADCLPAWFPPTLRVGITRSIEAVERRLWGLSPKQYWELKWWQEDLQRRVDWYRGRLAELEGIPSPGPGEQVSGASEIESALWTWLRCTAHVYPRRLGVAPDHFRGMRVLDVGCGPLPMALAFTGCEVYGLDDLLERYRRVGYPLHRYPDRMRYLTGGAEAIPMPDGFFDAVISVNAIDHVDDFAAAAREIARVLRPGGILRIEAHYHAPNACEPWALDDDLMRRHYGHLGLRKVHERVPTVHEQLLGEGEKLVLWATD